MMLTITALFNSKNKKGIMKVIAKINFEINVINVDFQTCFKLLLLDSSEICIPKESESASATAITKIPLKTTDFIWVPELSPTIKPSVVIIPDVKPNPSPFSNDFSITLIYVKEYLKFWF